MSSVRMQGNIGGTGVITVSSPNTNSDRAIVLPDASGTVQVSGSPISGTTGTFTGLVDISAAGAGQIQFPSTQNASANANTLDDYEEGTWTPTNNGGMSGFTAINGTYTKIGRAVQVRGAFSITAVTTNMLVGGLPFTSMNQTFYSVVDQNIPVAIAYKQVDSNSTVIQWNVNATGSFSVTIQFTAWYFSAS